MYQNFWHSYPKLDWDPSNKTNNSFFSFVEIKSLFYKKKHTSCKTKSSLKRHSFSSLNNLTVSLLLKIVINEYFIVFHHNLQTKVLDEGKRGKCFFFLL